MNFSSPLFSVAGERGQYIISPMPRSAVRVTLILLLLAVAIVAPLVLSGYSELEKAPAAKSYLEMAKHYWNAAQRLPWRGDAYELAGHAYYHAEEYARAQSAYERAFGRHVLSAQGWVAWGDVHYLMDDHARAAQIWEQGLRQKDPSTDLYSRLSQTHQETGNYAQAAEFLQKYVALHQDDAAARYRLGLLLTLTDPGGALSELIRASQLDPQFDPAVETLRSALNLASLSDSSSARLVLIGRGLALVQEWELARAAFESAIEVDQKNAEAWGWLGEAKQHLAEEGLSELDRALVLNPDSSTVRGLRGLYFQRASNFREALPEFEAAAHLDPKNPAWQVSLGETYSKLGDLIRALQAYQAATNLAPEEPQYWRLLALFCAQNNVNVKDVGILAAEKAVILAKNDAASLDLLGWLLLLDARYEDSERQLLRAIEADSQNASAHFHLGMLYMEKQDRISAYDHFLKSRDLGSTDAQAVLNQYFP